MSYTQSWLEDPGRARGLLVVATAYNVAQGSPQPFYFSTMGFITTNGVVFNPIMAKDLEITESIDLNAEINISYGDIELHNPNGEWDDLLDNTKYIWSNREVQVYYGDPTWVVADASKATLSTVFSLVYDGIIDDCKSRSKSTINLLLRDKQERLNVSVTENKIGTKGVWGAAAQTNQDNIRPLVFGEVHNMTPVLVDPSTLTYMFNDGPYENLIEVRDNGYPIYRFDNPAFGTLTINTGTDTGTFSLSRPAAGTITCSVQGVKTTYNVSSNSVVASTYINTIPDMVRLLATNYGSTTVGRFSSTEIDNANFQNVLINSISSASYMSCGYVVTDRENLLEVIKKLCRSIGGQAYVTKTGLLQILRLGIPTTDPTVNITNNDILLNTFTVVDKTNPIGAVKLAYAKNWTVQQNLATFIPDRTKTDFETDWFVETATDTAVINTYKLSSDVAQRETYLVNGSETLTEANRLLDYYKVTRTIYGFTLTSKFIGLKLGQSVNLTYNRFGLSGGKTGQVTKLTPRWCKGLIDVEVIV